MRTSSKGNTPAMRESSDPPATASKPATIWRKLPDLRLFSPVATAIRNSRDLFPKHLVNCGFGIDVGDTLEQRNKLSKDFVIAISTSDRLYIAPYTRLNKIARRERSLVFTKHNSIYFFFYPVEFNDEPIKSFVSLPDVRRGHVASRNVHSRHDPRDVLKQEAITMND